MGILENSMKLQENANGSKGFFSENAGFGSASPVLYDYFTDSAI